MSPRIGVGAFVFDADGRVLVVERGKPPSEGLWSVPGGSLELGETLAQATAREVREETGLVVEIGPLVCVAEAIGADYHFVIVDYLAHAIGGALAAGGDARDARFVDDAELAQLPTTAGFAPALVRARATEAPWNARSR